MVFLLINTNISFFISIFFYFIFYFSIVLCHVFINNQSETWNTSTDSNDFQSDLVFNRRKTHPIELTIESGSIRGEYLVITFFILDSFFLTKKFFPS